MQDRQEEKPPSQKTLRVYEGLKRKILGLGFVRPGSLVKRFMPCGKPSCCCMGKPPRLHGPYYQWSCKLAGKTRTVRLSKEQARLCRPWTINHRSLRRLLRQMEQLSLIETDRALGAISRL
jgi:hypothetical protein